MFIRCWAWVLCFCTICFPLCLSLSLSLHTHATCAWSILHAVGWTPLMLWLRKTLVRTYNGEARHQWDSFGVRTPGRLPYYISRTHIWRYLNLSSVGASSQVTPLKVLPAGTFIHDRFIMEQFEYFFGGEMEWDRWSNSLNIQGPGLIHQK